MFKKILKWFKKFKWNDDKYIIKEQTTVKVKPMFVTYDSHGVSLQFDMVNREINVLNHDWNISLQRIYSVTLAAWKDNMDLGIEMFPMESYSPVLFCFKAGWSFGEETANFIAAQSPIRDFNHKYINEGENGLFGYIVQEKVVVKEEVDEN